MVRAATRGLELALAIIGGSPDRFSALTHLYRRTLIDAGHDPANLPLSVHAHGFVAETMEEAVETFYPSYAVAMSRIGRERGWGPMTPEQFRFMISPEGSLVIGNPDNVAEKIVR